MKSILTKNILGIIVTSLSICFSAGCAPSADLQKQKSQTVDVSATAISNVMDELNPFDPNIEEKLNQMDAAYIAETGMSPFLPESTDILAGITPGCEREACTVYAAVDKSDQKLYLYQNGVLTHTFLTSTGAEGFGTPNFEGHPNGRIYDKYTSTKYPGGDYLGLGNMPYAVFYYNGFAIHGTGKGNWSKLGTPASHGCTRVHPDNGFIFNRLVRQHGIKNVWITVRM